MHWLIQETRRAHRLVIRRKARRIGWISAITSKINKRTRRMRRRDAEGKGILQEAIQRMESKTLGCETTKSSEAIQARTRSKTREAAARTAPRRKRYKPSTMVNLRSFIKKLNSNQMNIYRSESINAPKYQIFK